MQFFNNFFLLKNLSFLRICTDLYGLVGLVGLVGLFGLFGVCCRIRHPPHFFIQKRQPFRTAGIFAKKMVVGDGFEPSKAWPVDLQSTAFDRSATPPRDYQNYHGAGKGNRTLTISLEG